MNCNCDWEVPVCSSTNAKAMMGKQGPTPAQRKRKIPPLSLLLHVGINIFLAIDALASAGFTPIMLIIAPMSGLPLPLLPIAAIMAAAQSTRRLYQSIASYLREALPPRPSSKL